MKVLAFAIIGIALAGAIIIPITCLSGEASCTGQDWQVWGEMVLFLVVIVLVTRFTNIGSGDW